MANRFVHYQFVPKDAPEQDGRLTGSLVARKASVGLQLLQS